MKNSRKIKAENRRRKSAGGEEAINDMRPTRAREVWQ